MLDQKKFGEKLRNHRKSLGFTQEEVAEKIGVSAQAVSKWEAGDCLPDCFNLKSIVEIYKISADVLLETESGGDIDAVSAKIGQISTEFVWARSEKRYTKNIHKELGDDLWEMWKSIYFVEIGDPEMQKEAKVRGNDRIIGSYGTKIWEDNGVACVIKQSLIKNLSEVTAQDAEVINAICTPEGHKLIMALDCQTPTSKKDIAEKTGIEISRLNELLLLFTENRIIEFVSYKRISNINGYKICGHCGIVAYMVLAAIHIMNKKTYGVSEYIFGD